MLFLPPELSPSLQIVTEKVVKESQHSNLKQGAYKKIKGHKIMGSMTWVFFVSVYIFEKQDGFEREFRMN